MFLELAQMGKESKMNTEVKGDVMDSQSLGKANSTMLSYNENSLGYWDNNCWRRWDWHTCYPISLNTVTVQDKFEKAFKIVEKLMAIGIIKDVSVKQFIELINEITKVL